MTQKEYLAIAFCLSFLAHFYWSLYIAYPLVIDTSIKKGKSWLYLPLKWKGLYKKTIQLITPILNLTIYSLGLITLWVYLYQISPMVFVVAALALMIVHLGLSSFGRKRRFVQQEDSFFHIRGQVQQNLKTSGKTLSENEVNSLASFQHQNLLREADKIGKLKEAMIKQSRLAKSHKSKRKEISPSLN